MIPLKVAIFDEVRKTVPELSEIGDDLLNAKIFHHGGDDLRLTYVGVRILQKAFTAYSFQISLALKAKHQMGLSKLEYPYYITYNKLTVFSDTDAMVIKLAGSVERFLENNFQIDRTE